MGSHGRPSAGMQYVHRKLQRSVTEMRRSFADAAERVEQRPVGGHRRAGERLSVQHAAARAGRRGSGFGCSGTSRTVTWAPA